MKKTSDGKLIISWDEFWDGFSKEHTDPRKADCSKCKYRAEVIGSAHIACSYLGPAGFLEVALTGMPPTIETQWGEIPVVYANETGIRKGYFQWPINFDPVWLWWCLLYEAKD
jgi:hypothetical protein